MQIPANRVYLTKEETIEGWQAWKAGDKKAFDKLQCTASKIAITAAHAFLERGRGAEERGLSRADVEDCVQEAVIAALEALNRWDPSKGHLSTLVTPRAEGAVQNWVDTESNKGMATKHDPNAVSFDSLDESAGNDYDDDGEPVEVQSRYGEEYSPDPLDILIAEEEHREKRKSLAQALAALPDEDRVLVHRAFGTGGFKAETHQAIAKSLGYADHTPVTKRLARIQAKMKEFMEGVAQNS